MTSNSSPNLFILLLGFLFGELKSLSLPQRDAHIIDLPANSSIIIHPVGLLKDTAYILCQAHTQIGNITLSMKPDIKYNMAVSGRDIGVVTMYAEKSNITWYLFSNSSVDIKVLVHLTYFTDTDPLVGGCNEESNLENDPNINLKVQSTKFTVDFEWSNSGINPSTGTYPVCEDTVYQSDLEYNIYVKYLEADDFSENEYFKVIKQMLTAKDVTKHGTWLNKFSNVKDHKSNVDLASYSDRGVVYNIVVKFNKDGVHARAVYIPIVSYGCDIEHTDKCKQRDIASLILSTVGGLVGLFLCFFGHRFFRIENFLFGFLIFGLGFYQVLALSTNISFVGTLALAAIFGLIGGTLLLALWWNYGIPVINVLFIGLVTGYLISSILFYTPFGNLIYFQSAFNYGATFACGVLVVPVFLLYFTRFLSIFSCAMVGGFTFVLMFDMYLHSSLHVIILNSIRHGTDKSYVTMTVTAPYTCHEITLTIVWGILVILGTGFQLFRERKKAPFPPSPRQMQDRVKDLRRLLQSPTTRHRPENEPLIRGGNQSSYGTTHNASLLDDETDTTEEENYRPGMI